ncbi:Disease resistance protein L6, partial [Cucurbita argyrosperma subsp. sororia]
MMLHYDYWTQDESSIGVYMVGIYGIGGIGKTTLAKALYNKIANQFEACFFLSNVKGASKLASFYPMLRELQSNSMALFNYRKSYSMKS